MTEREPSETQNPFPKKQGLARLWQAMSNSLAGMAEALRTERAFRLEMILALVLVPAACVLPVTQFERAMLIAAVLLVLIVELLNSAIETVVDRISLDRHPMSGRAKDLASAAVFFSLLLVAIVWALVVLPYYV